MAKQSGLSSDLLAAQQRLVQLRQQRRAERIALGLPVVTDEHGRSLPDSQPSFTLSLEDFHQLPDHLGWHSDALTASLRWLQQPQSAADGRPEIDGDPWSSSRTAVASSAAVSPTPEPDTIVIYPDLALGLLRHEQASAGRIWLLLRYMDNTGRGWIEMEQARAALAKNKQASLYVCGWRQLRNLLAQGEGTFWQRQGNRIWLRSVAKVAAALNIRRLTGAPVAFPVNILIQKIGTVRAHFYASFHSGRTKMAPCGQTDSMPISRATMQDVSHLSRQTQRLYEKKARVHKRYNFAVGAEVTASGEQSAAWQQGQALFRLIDHEGQQGPAGKAYLAWQLPNNYFGPHIQQSRGSQKRINRKLADLFMKGITGNGEVTVETPIEQRKRFYGNGRLAAKAYNRRASSGDTYWRSADTSGRHGWQQWHCLPEIT